ncbi:MAG: hypothetical protein U0T82_14025 [Bacteroidales bacterium]
MSALTLFFKAIPGRFILPVLLFMGWDGVLLFSQPPPVQWGKVTPDMVAGRPSDTDTVRGAVVLCDYGTAGYGDIKGSLRVVYFRHTRVRVFSVSGTQFANVRIPLRKKFAEEVIDLKAQSFNLDPNGGIISRSLSPSGILEENINEDFINLVFTVPDVRENSVFEYSYRLVSSDIYNYRTWQFQKTIPVLWSEYRAEIGGHYNYMAVFHNQKVPLAINEKQDTVIGIPSYLLGISSLAEEFRIKLTFGRWAAAKIPPLPEEKFVFAPADHLQEIRFQLYSVTKPGQNPIAFIKDWPDIGKILSDDERLGRLLFPDRLFKSIIKDILDGTETETQKAEKIYSWLQKNFSWNGQNSIRATTTMAALNGVRSGNAADLNLFMVNLFREAGLEAFPVLISTLYNGRIQKEVPILSQFNKTIARVTCDGRKVLTDVCDPLIPFGRLPLEDMNNAALVLSLSNVEWITIPEPGISHSYSTHIFRFAEDGRMSGFMVLRESGYKAVESLTRIQKSGLADFAHELADRVSFGLSVDSYKLVVSEIRKDSILLQLSYSSDEWRNQFNNMQLIYFDAFLSGEFKENPFSGENRINPVEIPFPFDLLERVIIEIPEGYAIVDVPVAEKAELEGGGMNFQFNISNTEEVVQIQSRLQSTKRYYLPETYPELKSFFGLISSKYAEHIVAEREDEQVVQ